MRKNKRKGRPPNRNRSDIDDYRVSIPRAGKPKEYISISFRFLEDNWGFDELTENQLREFLKKWCKRCAVKKIDLLSQSKHGLGSEKLPKSKIKPSIPPFFQDVDKFIVYRHEKNLPMVGVEIDGVYYVIWIEKKYNDLYEHG